MLHVAAAPLAAARLADLHRRLENLHTGGWQLETQNQVGGRKAGQEAAVHAERDERCPAEKSTRQMSCPASQP